MRSEPGNLWGDQYPFERNHLQRTMTLTALACLFVVTAILLVRTDVAAVVGIALISAGAVSALAAASRQRYVRESRLGFVILQSRGGRFVFGSAAAVVVVGVLVGLLILSG